MVYRQRDESNSFLKASRSAARSSALPLERRTNAGERQQRWHMRKRRWHNLIWRMNVDY
jgi:hypothetical protein